MYRQQNKKYKRYLETFSEFNSTEVLRHLRNVRFMIKHNFTQFAMGVFKSIPWLQNVGRYITYTGGISIMNIKSKKNSLFLEIDFLNTSHIQLEFNHIRYFDFGSVLQFMIKYNYRAHESSRFMLYFVNNDYFNREDIILLIYHPKYA